MFLILVFNLGKFYRCRHGYFHVVNNDYTHWEMYAIGGSAGPTINSQGNRYLAPSNPFAKEVELVNYPNFLQFLINFNLTYREFFIFCLSKGDQAGRHRPECVARLELEI